MTRPKRTEPNLPRLTVEEARTGLYGFVERFRKVKRPSGSLFDRAVEVGPHRKGGLVMIPQVDAVAAVERLEEAEREREELLDELEIVGVALLAQERLAPPAPEEELIPVEDLARELGLERLLDE